MAGWPDRGLASTSTYSRRSREEPSSRDRARSERHKSTASLASRLEHSDASRSRHREDDGRDAAWRNAFDGPAPVDRAGSRSSRPEPRSTEAGPSRLRRSAADSPEDGAITDNSADDQGGRRPNGRRRAHSPLDRSYHRRQRDLSRERVNGGRSRDESRLSRHDERAGAERSHRDRRISRDLSRDARPRSPFDDRARHSSGRSSHHRHRSRSRERASSPSPSDADRVTGRAHPSNSMRQSRAKLEGSRYPAESNAQGYSSDSRPSSHHTRLSEHESREPVEVRARSSLDTREANDKTSGIHRQREESPCENAQQRSPDGAPLESCIRPLLRAETTFERGNTRSNKDEPKEPKSSGNAVAVKTGLGSSAARGVERRAPQSTEIDALHERYTSQPSGSGTQVQSSPTNGAIAGSAGTPRGFRPVASNMLKRSSAAYSEPSAPEPSTKTSEQTPSIPLGPKAWRPPTGPAAMRQASRDLAPPPRSNSDRPMTAESRLASTGSTATPVASESALNGTSQSPAPPPASPPPPPPIEPSDPEPPKSPSLPPPPPQLSFGHVPVPTELLRERAESGSTTSAKDLRGFRCIYDPALDKSKSKGDQILRRYEEELDQAKPSVDPRYRAPPPRGGRGLARSFVRHTTWEWDANSVGKRPAPPARALFVSDRYFRAFGRIETSELKLDPRNGQSLGMYWVKYAHDFDDEGASSPTQTLLRSTGKQQRGSEVAREALQRSNGQKLMQDTLAVVLDGERTKYVTAYRTELGKRYLPKPKQPAAASTGAQISSGKALAASNGALSATAQTASPMAPPTGPKSDRMQQQHQRSSSGPMHVPTGPRSQTGARGLSSPYVNGSVVKPGTPSHASGSPQLDVLHTPRTIPPTPTETGRDDDDMDTDSDDEDEFAANGAARTAAVYYGSTRGRLAKGASRLSRFGRSGNDGAPAAPTAPRAEREETMSSRAIQDRLASIGNPYVFVPRIQGCNARLVKEQFAGFVPQEVLADESGWHVAFGNRDAAGRAKMVLDRTTLPGLNVQISVEIRMPFIAPSRPVAWAPRAADVSDVLLWGSKKAHGRDISFDSMPSSSPRSNHFDGPSGRFGYNRKRELGFASHLRSDPIQDPQSRWVGDDDSDVRFEPIKPVRPMSPEPKKVRRRASAREGSVESVPPTPAGKVAPSSANELDHKRQHAEVASQLHDPEESREVKRSRLSADAKADTATPKVEDVQPSVSHLSGAAKATSEQIGDAPLAVPVQEVKARQSKKARIAETVVEEVVVEEVFAVPDQVAERQIAPNKKLKTVKALRARSPTPDPFTLGFADNEEDLYYAKLALERMAAGESVAPAGVPEFDMDEDDNIEEPHISGSARTEGFYKIPQADKAAHQPDRNRAVVDTSAPVGLASARDNRADSRRFVQGIEQHKKDTATDTDILKFNQLRTRKKQLKFAKSPIHDWGLYAMEHIPAGDMVIEYVGEVIRQQVADEREKAYERAGNFSTYLFRVDDDLVVDATRKGNIARLMNHCCTPNCNAKILTLNGEKRIVLYARTAILPGQELTYDYKFQSGGDEADAIPCLCGSSGCRRFL
ncbi:hypothetical protein IE81DRAFT_340627 [Ceraceosorus guamensis]|uniref:Histone-lysine N-methyltransferase, H3 lysine-4 specific n=1 Tax=Ceraceosorus guamensis TaxID=1522189 RepID=A0A316W1H3_9BASI|nr:hypothetical protein IE81DRAFT_340627 [Ceraceosorus guamensis]PWN43582.1 hypothetical protein IE81DRAFT_340627 [Ceraceosorus guamensis]